MYSYVRKDPVCDPHNGFNKSANGAFEARQQRTSTLGEDSTKESHRGSESTDFNPRVMSSVSEAGGQKVSPVLKDDAVKEETTQDNAQGAVYQKRTYRKTGLKPLRPSVVPSAAPAFSAATPSKLAVPGSGFKDRNASRLFSVEKSKTPNRFLRSESTPELRRHTQVLSSAGKSAIVPKESFSRIQSGRALREATSCVSVSTETDIFCKPHTDSAFELLSWNKGNEEKISKWGYGPTDHTQPKSITKDGPTLQSENIVSGSKTEHGEYIGKSFNRKQESYTSSNLDRWSSYQRETQLDKLTVTSTATETSRVQGDNLTDVKENLLPPPMHHFELGTNSGTSSKHSDNFAEMKENLLPPPVLHFELRTNTASCQMQNAKFAEMKENLLPPPVLHFESRTNTATCQLQSEKFAGMKENLLPQPVHHLESRTSTETRRDRMYGNNASLLQNESLSTKETVIAHPAAHEKPLNHQLSKRDEVNTTNLQVNQVEVPQPKKCEPPQPRQTDFQSKPVPKELPMQSAVKTAVKQDLNIVPKREMFPVDHAPQVSLVVVPSSNIEPKQIASPADSHVQHISQHVKPQEVVFQQPAKPTSGRKTIKVNGNSYLVMRALGRGGSSIVYQVLNEGMSDIFALKVVRLDSVEESTAAGYINEVRLLKDLQGLPRVVRLLESQYDENEEKLLMVMEKGDTDLSGVIRNRSSQNSLSPTLIRFYWQEMLEAVGSIHEKNVIHSDLKPANFLLVSGGLKLIDFGIASSIQSDVTSILKDTACGTYNYMAPEALKSTSPAGANNQEYKVSRKTDVWSLGCILYSLIYKSPPFNKFRDTFEKISAIVDEKYVIDFPSCGDPLAVDVLRACLSRNPKNRPTIEQLLSHPYLTYTSPFDVPVGRDRFSQLEFMLQPYIENGKLKSDVKEWVQRLM